MRDTTKFIRWPIIGFVSALAVAGSFSANVKAQTSGEAGAIRCLLETEWEHLGSVTRAGNQRLVFPRVEPVAGVYRFNFRMAELQARYVGESADLRARFKAYARSGGSTTQRIHEWIAHALRIEGTVDLAIAAHPKICRGKTGDLADIKERMLIERLGIYVECKQPIICLNIDRRRPREMFP